MPPIPPREFPQRAGSRREEVGMPTLSRLLPLDLPVPPTILEFCEKNHCSYP